MELCPNCGTQLAPNLVAAIKDPAQPDVRCPTPWKSIQDVPEMTPEIAERLWAAIFRKEVFAGIERGMRGMSESADKLTETLQGLPPYFQIVDETHDFHDQLPD